MLNIFKGCSGLEQIAVEVGNKQYDSRDNCNAIIETESNTLISGCKSTVIPNNVVSISHGAFYLCSSLTSISIPNSVTFIGEYAFYGCVGLQGIYSLIETPFALDVSAFEVWDNDPEMIYATVPLYVPKGCKSLYQQTEGWKLFQTIEEKEPSGIDFATTDRTAPALFYSVSGRQVSQSQKGLNIIRTADGTVRKVMVK